MYHKKENAGVIYGYDTYANLKSSDRNSIAKDKMLACLKNSGYDVILPIPGTDQYGIDIISSKFDMAIHVEIKWTKDEYPYSTIHIPIKYKKFMRGNKKCYMGILSNDFSHAVILDGMYLKVRYISETNSKNIKDELFYNIPIRFCKKVNLSDKIII